MSTRTFTFNVTAPGAPQWFTNLTPGKWTAIATTGTITAKWNTLPSKPGGIGTWMPGVTAFSGGTTDQARKRFYVWGGGHNSYYGNEVYSLDLSKNTLAELAWDFLVQPTPGSLGAAAGPKTPGPIQAKPEKNCDMRYTLDDESHQAPMAGHSYNTLVVANDRLWIVGHSAPGVQVQDSSVVFSYGLSSGTWTAHGWVIPNTLPDVLSILNNYYDYGWVAGTAPNFVNGKIWGWYQGSSGAYSGAPRLFSIDATGGAINPARYSEAQVSGFLTGHWSAVIPSATAGKSLILYGGDGNNRNNTLFVFNPEDPTAGAANIASLNNLTGTTPVLSNGYGVYLELYGQVVMFTGQTNGEVYWAPLPATRTGAWTVRKYDPTTAPGGSSATLPGKTGQNNTWLVYSRFNVIQNMGNNEACLVYLPEQNVNGATYVMRVPVGGFA